LISLASKDKTYCNSLATKHQQTQKRNCRTSHKTTMHLFIVAPAQ